MNQLVPILYVVILTHLGYRAYAKKELSAVSDIEGNILDGSWILDGSQTLGASLGFLEKSARLQSERLSSSIYAWSASNCLIWL